jgi:crotonobetainyl-CoA:carnitine CoA-transferase CaiB-like acyl-CoA transferase
VKLHAAGIGAHAIVEDVATLRDDPYVRAHGLAITREHEGFGQLTTNGPSQRLSRTPPVPGRPASKPGSDAASILAEIGMAGELDRLVKQGIVTIDGVGVR